MTYLLFAIALAALAAAQDSRANGPSPLAFEVVSVKPSPSDHGNRLESYCSNGGRFISRGVPLLWSVKWAYGLNDYQMNERAPDWLNSFDSYDIQAEPGWRVTEDECRMMVRSLFEDRFKLKMGRQVKTVSVFALIVGKSGPRLPDRGKVMINGTVKQATSEREAPDGWTMARLANYLSSVRAIGHPVVDETRIAGTHGSR